MWIQIILIIAIIAIGILFIRRPGSDRHLAIRRLVLGLFVLVAILSVLFPQWLSWVANLIGVGRGTDLVLYALVVVFLATVLAQYRRFAAQDRRITLLARQLALSEARRAETDANASVVDADSAKPE